MEMVTITKISRFTTGKDGLPLKTKTGKPYTRVIIQTEEYEKPLSGFENPETKTWDVGTKAEIEVKQSGEYLNFATPKKDAVAAEGIKEIREDIGKIMLRVGRLLNGMDILLDRTNTNKSNKAPDARDIRRTPGDNITAFDAPEEEPPF